MLTSVTVAETQHMCAHPSINTIMSLHVKHHAMAACLVWLAIAAWAQTFHIVRPRHGPACGVAQQVLQLWLQLTLLASQGDEAMRELATSCVSTHDLA